MLHHETKHSIVSYLSDPSPASNHRFCHPASNFPRFSKYLKQQMLKPMFTSFFRPTQLLRSYMIHSY